MQYPIEQHDVLRGDSLIYLFLIVYSIPQNSMMFLKVVVKPAVDFDCEDIESSIDKGQEFGNQTQEIVKKCVEG